jgi:hypothetical protein
MSNGERISKKEIDRRVREAKKQLIQDQLNEHGFNFCEDCAMDGGPYNADSMELCTLDCSHTIGVSECQKSGKSEMAWDLENLRVRCRAHHRKIDKLDLKFKNSNKPQI